VAKNNDMKNFQRGGSTFGAKKTGGYRKDAGRPSRGGFGASRGASRTGGAGAGRSFSKPTFSQGFHKAICSNCGKPCEVPFKPIEGKTVYCKDCFKKNDSGDFREGRSSGASSYSKPYDRKSAFKPGFKKDSFRKEYAPAGRGAPSKDYSKELAEINSKLDHILQTLADLEIDDEDSED